MLRADLAQRLQAVNKVEEDRAFQARRLSVIESEMTARANKLVLLHQCMESLKLFSAKHSADIVRTFNDFVSDGLSYILEENYRLIIDTTGQVSFNVVHRGVSSPVLTTQGGGIVDLVSFLMLVCNAVVFNKTRILVLDEPWKHLSEDALPRLFTFIDVLSEKFDFQFIAVTHNPLDGIPETRRLKIYRVSLEGDKTKIC